MTGVVALYLGYDIVWATTPTRFFYKYILNSVSFRKEIISDRHFHGVSYFSLVHDDFMCVSVPRVSKYDE